MIEQTSERTRYEVELDISYGACWNALNERLFSRLDWFYGAITLFGGSAIVFTVTANNRTLAALLGAIVAVSAILERLTNAVEKKLEHRSMKRQFFGLASECGSLDLAEMEKRLKLLQSESPTGLKGLEMVAYNNNVSTHGRSDYAEPLTLWNKTLKLLA